MIVLKEKVFSVFIGEDFNLCVGTVTCNGCDTCDTIGGS